MLIYLQMLESPEEKSILEQIYLEYRGLMYHVAYEILHNEQDAEDAVQDSFVRIIDNLDKINNPYSRKTKSYITVITKNVCLDMIRRNHKDEELEDKDIPFKDNYTDLENSNATYEQIIKNLRQLPPRLKNIAFLFFVQRLSPKEIGEMLNINTNTVYAYVSRIRKILLDTKDENI